MGNLTKSGSFQGPLTGKSQSTLPLKNFRQSGYDAVTNVNRASYDQSRTGCSLSCSPDIMTEERNELMQLVTGGSSTIDEDNRRVGAMMAMDYPSYNKVLNPSLDETNNLLQLQHLNPDLGADMNIKVFVEAQ